MKSALLLSLSLTVLSVLSPARAADSPIAVSISVPERGNERVLEFYGSNPHFHVIVSNVSDKPQRVWREWCSWGYDGLSFEFTDAAGKTWIASKKPGEWNKNFPDFWTIPPNENLVLEVFFADAEVWQGFPRPQGVSEVFTMRAIFEFQPDDQSREHSVWTGRVVSKAGKYVFYK